MQGITYVQTKLGVNALIQGKKVANTKYLDGVDLSGKKRHKFMVWTFLNKCVLFLLIPLVKFSIYPMGFHFLISTIGTSSNLAPIP